MYGLEENSSYDCSYKDEIEDVIKLVSWYGSSTCEDITIEFMFAGINMFWARLRLILARAVRLGLK